MDGKFDTLHSHSVETANHSEEEYFSDDVTSEDLTNVELEFVGLTLVLDFLHFHLEN